LLEQQGNLVLHAKEHAAEIDIDDPVPLLFREFGRRRDRLFYAGVVEGEVEAPEGLDRLLQRGLHIVVPRHIAFDRERAPAGLLDHACRFLVAMFRKVGRHHTGALARESQRRRAADAVGRPGYERNLPCETFIVVRHRLLLSASFT
jgi:hypothetical protein